MTISLFSLSKILISFVYSNFVTNGNFVDTTGWSISNSALTASSNTLIITGNGGNATAAGYQQTTTIAASKKIYVIAKMRITNAVCTRMRITLPSSGSVSTTTPVDINTPVENQWYEIGGVATTGTGTGNLRVQFNHTYANAAAANGKVMEVQEVLAIDLTALFGANNEPTAADCANIFKFLDGTKQPSFSKVLAV